MSAYEFDLILSGLDMEGHAQALDTLGARVDDITFARSAGVMLASVERRAPSLGAAIRSAIADVESLPGVGVVRVEPDEHVSQTGIASRLGRSRQSVSQLVSGTRGPGGFPPPAFESGHVALWRWSDVSRWAREAGVISVGVEDRSRAVVRAVNAVLEAKRAVAALNEDERLTLAGLGA